MKDYTFKKVMVRFKNSLKVLVFMAGVLGMVCFLSNLLERRSAENKYAQILMCFS